jgi:hypothetical protein
VVFDLDISLTLNSSLPDLGFTSTLIIKCPESRAFVVQEVLGRPNFDQTTRVKHKHLVKVHQALQAMGDHDNGSVPEIFSDDSLNCGIRSGINSSFISA